MKNITGSGSATNAGIDYQQRVSAWFLVMMFTGTRISPLLGLPDDLIVMSVAYENAEHIDDLKLICPGGYTVYLQIKRRLHLSTTEQSDFFKTIDQFVRQYVASTDPKDSYLLTTSSETSGAITKTLKKLTESYRLNPEAPQENPLSKEEQRVLTTCRSFVQSLYKKHSANEMSEPEFAAFMKHVFINILDVENGGTHEYAAITLMLPLFRVPPELIWALLIKNSLHYAKNRLSITSENLFEILALYRLETREGTPQGSLSISEKWKLIATGTTIPSTGKELVIVESFMPEVDYLVLEFSRFDGHCNKRLQFSGSTVIWGRDKTESKVICRYATIEGIHRFIDENIEIFKDKSIAIIPAKDIENVEETICAQMHAELCMKLLQERDDPGKCLHCGKALSQHMVTLVELDDSDTAATVGGVHEECQRPVDRVLGRLQFPVFEHLDFLRYFDAEKWITLFVKGQMLFNELRQAGGRFGPISIIGWNPENEGYRGFDYCVKVNLKDGIARYLTSRGKLDRYPKQLAEERAAEMNAAIADSRAKNDPACYTSINWTFGNYSRLTSIKDDEEECIECISADAVKYNEQIGHQYSCDVQYYTPLLYLVTGDDESPFVLVDHLVFLTSPLDFDKTLRNWKEAGVTVGRYEMRIAESDQTFDKMLMGALGSGLRVVVDPLLDRNGKLVKGHIIVDIESAKMMTRHT